MPTRSTGSSRPSPSKIQEVGSGTGGSNAVRPPSGKVDLQTVVGHFSRRCRAVRLVPFDPHLETGAEISLEELNRETREALIELAAVVADGFPGSDRRDLRA